MGLLFSLVLTVKLSFTILPVLKQGIKEINQTAKTIFPNDLAIAIKDGQWSINQPEPFVTAFPNLEGNQQDYAAPKNFVVLFREGTIDDLTKYDTIALINSKNILVRESGGFKAYPLENLPNGEIRKQDFDNFIDKTFALMLQLANLGILAIFLWAVLSMVVFRGIYVPFFAGLTWLVGRIANFKLNYDQASKLSIHTITLPLTVYAITKFFGYTIPFVFWFSLLHLLFIVVVIVYLAKEN